MKEFSNFSACKSTLGLGKYYQDIRKNIRKITIGNRNICEVLKNFQSYPVDFSFFNRFYLRKRASWTPKLLRVRTQLFGLISKSDVRISKFALIKKLEKIFKIFCLEVNARAWQVLSGSVKNCSKNHHR